MRFSQYKYNRPDIKKLETKYNSLLYKFDSAKSPAELERTMTTINNLRNEFFSMSSIASVRNSINTVDKTYKKEKEYFDKINPLFSQVDTRYYQALIKTPHRKTLEKKWGKQLFVLAELAIKVFKPEIVKDLQMENKLSTGYTDLLASAKI